MWEFIVGAAVLAVGVLIGWAINATQEPKPLPPPTYIDTSNWDKKAPDGIRREAENSCGCGAPKAENIVHRANGPCYLKERSEP